MRSEDHQPRQTISRYDDVGGLGEYLSNLLTNFDEMCMAMHITRSDRIGNQKFENLKIWKSIIADHGRHKNRKNVIFRISSFYKILHGSVDLA